MLGFGSCKTAKTAAKENVDAVTEAKSPNDGKANGDSLTIGGEEKVVPQPAPRPERVVVLYGVRPPQKPVKIVPPDNR